MTGDGICDDVTNNRVCLFDGGDCCHGEKSGFCLNCTCYTLGNPPGGLQKRMESLKVKVLADPREFNDIVKANVIKVQDVASLDVCLSLCMDQEQDRDVNTWSYHPETKTCQCAICISTLCLKPEVRFLEPNEQTLQMEPATGIGIAFVMMSRTLPCGNLEKIAFKKGLR